MKKYYQYKTVKQYANAWIRSENKGSIATDLKVGSSETPILGKDLDCGFRKKTTGEYVPNAYMNNFGWKNCYYQPSVREVFIPIEVYLWFGWRE